MWTYQNEHNMLLNFVRCLSILLLQTSKTDNNALDIDAIYNLKLRKTQPNSTDSFITKLNAKCIMPKHENAFYQVFWSSYCTSLILNLATT
jgi:hypothetical protein